ncbi:MAG: hypothetical protein Q7S96_00440 [bacterium]|nr:hypothetical protein [bacterium]
MVQLPAARAIVHGPDGGRVLEVMFGGGRVAVDWQVESGFRIRTGLCGCGAGLEDANPGYTCTERSQALRHVIATLPSPLQVRAEELIIAGVVYGALQQSQDEALRCLHEAVASRPDDVPLWLNTCAKLGAQGAAPVALGILRGDPQRTWFLAAVEAARGVGRGTPYATNLADHLIAVMDTLLEEDPYVAARALMSIFVLEDPRGISELARRLHTWPIKHLRLALGVAIRSFIAQAPVARGAIPSASQLYELACTLEASLQERTDQDAGFTRAKLLQLIAVLAPPSHLKAILQVLCRAHAHADVVVKSGAAYAMWILLHEQGERVAVHAAVLPGGTKLLAIARRTSSPREYRYGTSP